MKINFLGYKVFLLFAFTFALSTQDLVSDKAKVENGMITAGGYQVPIFKNVKEVYLLKYSDGSLQVNFSIMLPDGPNAGDQAARDRKALIKFYTGKTIFGVKVAGFEESLLYGAPMESATCSKDKATPSLMIRIIGGEEEAGNLVTISNKCRKSIN